VQPGKYGPSEYSPIIDRQKPTWPHGVHVTRALRDHGNRIGVFQLMQTMARHGVRRSVALNSHMCRFYPRILQDAALIRRALEIAAAYRATTL